jgi:hypothetical protein
MADIDTKKLRERLARLPRGPWRWGDPERREHPDHLYSERGDSEIGPGFPILWLEKGSSHVTLADVTEFVADSRTLFEQLLDESGRLREIAARHNDEAIKQDAAWCSEREDLRGQLAAMTAARDRLADIAQGASEVLCDLGDEYEEEAREELIDIAELRKVGASAAT